MLKEIQSVFLLRPRRFDSLTSGFKNTDNSNNNVSQRGKLQKYPLISIVIDRSMTTDIDPFAKTRLCFAQLLFFLNPLLEGMVEQI